MIVQDLFIYPVKSLSGIRVESANALGRGFQFDRRWMLVDDTGECITQRIKHQLALINTQIIGDNLIISHRYSTNKPLFIPIIQTALKKINVSIWDDQVESLHVSEDADNWFSEFLQQTCKLVYMPEDTLRPVDEQYSIKKDQVSFADSFPYLLIGQASLDDLNLRLKNPVPMNRFRPSIVISTTEPYIEDTWSKIRIGNIRFKVAKPCARCVLTTVDQETAKKGKEPLLTLSKYRTVNNKVLFGQNLLAINTGIIKLSDPVEIISYK